MAGQTMVDERYAAAGTVGEVRAKGVVLVEGDGVTIAVFADGDRILAVDNRCPHMGFPLHRGSLRDGILTCHWHHARFDAASGCAFDLFADDVPSYEVRIVDRQVLVSRTPRRRADARFYRERLQRGLDIGVGLIQAKALLGLLDDGQEAAEVIAAVAGFAARRLAQWGEGLVRLTCVANLAPYLSADTRYVALYYATRQIAAEAAGAVPHRLRGALDGDRRRLDELSRWLSTFVAARHADGVERTLATALRTQSARDAAGLLSGAATQRLYAEGGHLLDSCNKMFELIDHVGADDAETHAALLAGRIAAARGEEEGSAWRHPVDLVSAARDLEESLPALLEQGAGADGNGAAAGAHGADVAERADRADATDRGSVAEAASARAAAGRLLPVLLGDDGPALVAAIGGEIAGGTAPRTLSAVVAYAAGLRLARFSAANDVGDWFSAQHTFIFANAADRAVRRNPATRTVAAIVQAALAVHADRFLNVPPARLPGERGGLDALPAEPQELLDRLLGTMDRRSAPGEADALTARYLRTGGPPERLIDTLAYATVREDLDFHSLQVLEAAVAQGRTWGAGPEREHLMVGVARNLAAHCPTRRAGLSTALIARRLHRGQALYEDDDAPN